MSTEKIARATPEIMSGRLPLSVAHQYESEARGRGQPSFQIANPRMTSA